MRNSLIFGQVLVLAALSANTSISSAVTYKWVDADGNTHYTQSPPPGDTKAETIKPPPRVNPEYDKKQAVKRQKLLDKSAESRKNSAAEKQKAEAEKAANKAKCEQARARLASYERPRVNLIDEDGNYTVAPEETRQAELKKSRELVNKLCN